jgi:hypothetical protein
LLLTTATGALVVEIVASFLGSKIEALIPREPATAEHHHAINQLIQKIRRLLIGANALLQTPPRLRSNTVLGHHAVEHLCTFLIATRHALAVLAGQATFAPAAATTAAITTTLLAPATRFALHTHLVEVTTALFQGKFKALIKGHPDAAEIDHAPVDFLGQFGNFFALGTLLQTAPTIRIGAREVHHAANHIVTRGLPPRLALAAIALHVIGAPAADTAATV